MKQDKHKKNIFNYYKDAFRKLSKDVFPIFYDFKRVIDIESLKFVSLNLDQSS